MTGEIYIFVCSVILSFISGMAYVYRTKEAPTFKQIFATGINTGMAGLGITMIWYYKFSEYIYILLGSCILIGLMGPIGVEWVLSQFRKGTFVINFKKDSGELNVGDEKK